MMSGSASSKSDNASIPSRATVTRKPSLFRPMTSASMKDSSSSASRTLTGPSRRTPAALLLLFRLGHVTRSRLYREHERECRALAFARLDVDPPLMVVGDMAHDRQAEPRATRVAAAAVVDTVEALEDAVEVTGRDADAVVLHR